MSSLSEDDVWRRPQDQPRNGALAGLRVVEMVDNDAALAGKLLADLGAEVIKIENPNRDLLQVKGPSASNREKPDLSLRWLSCNLAKQRLQLDVETQSGRTDLTELLSTANIFLESSPPGYLDGLGLDYLACCKLNPGLVVVSITPFGQSGPYSGYSGDDLVLWAMGGMLYVTGREDGPPLQPSMPQAYMVAGTQAALAAMIAHTFSRRTGLGQHVDLSVQACIPWVAQTAPDYWPCFRGIQRRGGVAWSVPSEVEPEGLRRTTTWRCRDGLVCAYLIAGGPAEKMNAALFRWMREEGFNPPAVQGVSWDYFGLRRIEQSLIDAIESQIAKFFKTIDKDRLFREGQKRGVMVYPVMDIAEVLANEQLQSRRYWSEVKVEHDRKIKVPTRWAHFSRTPIDYVGTSCDLGRHNSEWMKSVPSTPQTKVKEIDYGSKPRPKQSFDGLVVADFSWAVAGPLTTKYLAEHGATVVRVESCDPRSMDIVRSVPPYYDNNPSFESSGLFHRLNLNKHSLGLDLVSSGGRELARRLVLRADVVVENFRPGVMAKWGLDYDSLSRENPALIYLSSTNLGQTGPLSSYGGFGNLLTAYAGFYALTGWPKDEPLPLPGAYTDYIAPVLSGLALIAALRHRDRTGQGQYIDISQMECGLQMLGLPLLQQASKKAPWPRLGNRSPYACPHGVFPCLGQDRWCAISIHNDRKWQACKAALGNPDTLEAEQFSTSAGRRRNQDDLERKMGVITSTIPARQLMQTLQKHGVPAGLAANSEDLFNDPQLNSRSYYQKLCHSLLGDHWVMQSPAVFSRTPQLLGRHAPCLGQDNESVCQEILGMTPAEIKTLADKGAFGRQTNSSQTYCLSLGKGEDA